MTGHVTYVQYLLYGIGYNTVPVYLLCCSRSFGIELKNGGCYLFSLDVRGVLVYFHSSNGRREPAQKLLGSLVHRKKQAWVIGEWKI